ncbi:hypothetical protein K523DRAFT_370739 [Schizophyllum commune Tattone D]|nr:hypothetical protein K523DRAFT_370739 [Schizophyllum commune Tattone D]
MTIGMRGGLMNHARGTTTTDPDDDQAPTSPTNTARAAGQRGYYGTIHVFYSRRSARELRALVQIQREQADDLRGLARNSDQLASLCVLQGMPTAPLAPRPGSPIWTFERLGNMWPDLARQFWESRLPSREGSLAETMRSSLRARHGSFASNSSGDAIAALAAPASVAAFGFSGNNVRGSRVSAPAVVVQARAEASPAAPHDMGDEDGDSNDSSFYTPRQSFSEGRDDAFPGDEFTEGLSSAPDAHGAVATPTTDDDTHIRLYREYVVDEAFPGLRLRIYVGPRHSLGDKSKPFYDGLPEILSLCRRKRHDLTQLHITIEHARVISQRGGGPGVDPLVTILRSIEDYLPYIHALQINYACDQCNERPSRLAEQKLCGAFTGLRRLRLEGSSSSARLGLFPLGQLRHLEIAVDISTIDLWDILRSCTSLDVLIVRSESVVSSYLGGVSVASDEAVHFPSAMCLEGDHFGLDLLRAIPDEIDLRLSVSQGCVSISEIKQIFESHNRRNRQLGGLHDRSGSQWLFRVPR